MSDSPLSTLNGDLGDRFKLVDLVPAIVLAATVGLLLFGDSLVGKDADGQWRWSAGLLVAVAFVGALALRPFQVRLVRYLEGYWKPTRIGKLLFELGVQRHLGRKRDLERMVNLGGDGAERTARERSEWAREQLLRYPADNRIMPTALGNALRSAEDEAGARYGLEAVIAFPRLFGVAEESVRSEYVSLVDQYDSNVRLSISVALTSIASAFIATIRIGPLGMLPMAGLALSWIFYRGAVESAALSGELLAVIVDLHRFELLERLRVPLPATPAEEFKHNDLLMQWFQQGKPGAFPVERYVHPAKPS